MNRKQFIMLLALVVVAGAAGLVVNRHSQDAWRSGGAAIGQKLLPNLAVNDIAQIRVRTGTNELSVARRDNVWRVHERADYPANFSQIRELIMKLADLKISQNEEVGPSQLGRFGLQPPGPATNSGTQFECRDAAGKSLATLLLGKKHLRKPAAGSPYAGMGGDGWPDGRYVMPDAAGRAVALISDPLDQIQPNPQQWLNKDFIHPEKPRAIAVQFPEATNSWRLTRASETNDWQLADPRSGEKLDPSKLYSVTSPFSSVSFNDVAPRGTNPPPSLTMVTVETFDGFDYTARIGPKDNDHYPVQVAVAATLATERTPAKDEKADDKARLDKEFKEGQARLADKLTREKQLANWVYQLPAYNVDELLKLRSQLLAEVSTNETAEAGDGLKR
jgi:hypothetical protein